MFHVVGLCVGGGGAAAVDGVDWDAEVGRELGRLPGFERAIGAVAVDIVFAVAQEDGTALGLVSNMFELASGLMLEVQGPKREFLLPFKKEFIRQIDRATRRLTVAVPDELLE